MSLHWKNAEIIANQGNLLGELFEYFEFVNPAICPRRKEFLEKIGESLGFEEKWVVKAIATKEV